MTPATKKKNAAKSERRERESQRLIAMGRDLERQEVIAHVRFKLHKFRQFLPLYREVFAELKRMETWLEKRFKGGLEK